MYLIIVILLKGGTIIDWDNIEKIYKFILDDELRSKPKEHNIMITEPLMNPRKNREKLAQIMFETFNIPGLFFENTAVLIYLHLENLQDLVLILEKV